MAVAPLRRCTACQEDIRPAPLVSRPGRRTSGPVLVCLQALSWSSGAAPRSRSPAQECNFSRRTSEKVESLKELKKPSKRR